MENKILKFCALLIYLVYAYLLGWQIYYFNWEIFAEKELQPTRAVFLRYMPAIVLLLFGVLLYSNVVLKQRRVLVFNSLFASAILSMYDTSSAIIMAVILVIFGLTIAAIEVQRR